jgi:2-polyprenyl-6-methoxyphenol hydroxylase-like FAD-dependent oxidoreductase
MLMTFQQRVVRVLEAALIEGGHRVEWSTGLTSFQMDEDGVVATVDRGGSTGTIRAGWIAGCDGSQSVVRRTLGLDTPGETSSLRILFCECDLDCKLSRDIWWLWQDREVLQARNTGTARALCDFYYVGRDGEKDRYWPV